MQIVPVPALQDNYIWLLREGSEAVCVCPGEAAPVLAYLREHNLNLSQIWLTHNHRDHTGGTDALLAAYPGCRVFGNRDIAQATDIAEEGGRIAFGGGEAEVWHVPGHTDTHIAFVLKLSDRHHVFCGDTLFSAGCGRVMTGTVRQLFDSLQRFNRLPPQTLFYPAHEYTAANLRFAAYIEPENAAVAQAAAAAGKVPTLPVTLAHERQINPFLRTGLAAVAERVRDLCGEELAGEAAVFAALRELKNRF